jgi:hypothetical protein
MSRFTRTITIATVLLGVVTTVAVAAGSGTVPGSWRTLAPEPFAIPQGQTSVWTGRQLIVFGRRPEINPSVDVAEAYDPARNAWRRLSPPKGPGYVPGYQSVWTGSQMLVFGAFHSVAYTPSTDTWRTLPKGVPGGIVVWTGREAIGWGGGCCGDAWSNGAAYDPTTGRYRALPRSPLAPSQGPLGAWTGRELVLLVDGIDPATAKPYPGTLARAAAYDPVARTWRRIAPLPVTGRFAGNAVWDGHDVLVAAAGPGARSTYAYDPAMNRWRRLASLPRARAGATAIWTGDRLILWGGQNLAANVPGGLRDGLVYEPEANRWSTIPAAPMRSSGSAVTWTGRSLLVVGGTIGSSKATNNRVVHLREGASFTPAR